jgi:hypothetical protein
MRIASVQNLNFPGPTWRAANTGALDANGFMPNRVGYCTETKRGGLIISQSKKGEDFAVNKSALEWIVAKERARCCVKGYVILTDRSRMSAFTNYPVCSLLDRLSKIEPNPGNGSFRGTGSFGPFWWINLDFEPVTTDGMPF